MKNPFKKEEARSWAGETAGEQEKRKNDAPNNPCGQGHLWAFTRYVFKTEGKKEVRYMVDDCTRGCGATRERKA